MIKKAKIRAGWKLFSIRPCVGQQSGESAEIKNVWFTHHTFFFSIVRATDGARTRDLHLGKVAYYQLYYCRISAPIPNVPGDEIYNSIEQ